MEQNWREYNKQDNYESGNVDPCQTCKYHHYEKPKDSFDWSSVWFGLLVICGIVCFSFYSKWQDDEAKLQNCVYYDEYTRSVHTVKNGIDKAVFSSSDLDYLYNLVGSEDDDD